MGFPWTKKSGQSTQDNNVDALVQEVTRLSRVVRRSAVLDIAAPGAGSVTAQHALGAVPTRWIVLDRDSAATIYRTAWTATTISLTFSAAANVTIEVS